MKKLVLLTANEGLTISIKAKVEKNLLDEEFGSLNRHIDDLSTILAAQWNSISQQSQDSKQLEPVDIASMEVSEKPTQNEVQESYLERYFTEDM